ncbi:60S ribosomal protein L10a-1 [Hordeum vulgare]|nr:60S ribosomal protein L10a-1 [Hordeum vulgare]
MMMQWLVFSPPHIVSLSANKWCMFRVHVQMFKDHMVLGRGWEYFRHRHRIVPNNLLDFKLSGLGLRVQIYNANSSIICKVRCTKHSCVGDIAQAL